MPPPSPVLPSLAGDQQYGAASNSAAQHLLSLISQQHQQGMIHPFNLSSTSGRKLNNINVTDYLHLTAKTIDRSSPHQRSAQEYPVFTPVKSYEEFLLGNSIPPDSSSKSNDSLEALRDEDWLSPLVLDDASDSHDLDVATVHTLHKPAGRLANLKPGAAVSSATLIHRKKIESRPYHITSIHPNKGPLAQKFKPRNRSAEFSRHLHQTDWNTSNAFSKKPLSELLSDIAAKKKFNQAATNRDTNNTHASQESATTTQSSIKFEPSTVRVDYSDNGCIQSCDKCLPGSQVTVVPLMDSRDYTDIPPRERDFSESALLKTKAGNNPIMSWFRSKKKPAGSQTPVIKGAKSQGNNSQSQVVEKERPNAVKEKLNLEEDKNLEMAVNYMKQEVSQANEKRDAALVEVFELKMAIEEMSKKLENLETYCQNLQHAPSKRFDNAIIAGDYGDDGNNDEMGRVSPGGTSYGPAKKEFYHAVTEARVGVKQFCRTLLQQIQEQSATEKIESILQPYNVRVAPRVSKRVRYHLESLINQAFYEDFENIKFQRSGTNCVLNPRQRSQSFYKTYLTISQMGWSELVSKESSAYSESFDGFCDQKMNRVEKLLNWEGRWPDELARSFFVAAKWVWLLHLLAFSFENPAVIFRVGSEARFDSLYMEELPVDQSAKIKQHNSNGNGVEAAAPQIRAMVMPGFFFDSYEVIKCKVLLSRQPVTPS